MMHDENILDVSGGGEWRCISDIMLIMMMTMTINFLVMMVIIILQWKVVEMTPVVERDRVEELRGVKDEVENA